MSTREHDGKTYLTLRANEVTLMSPRQGGEDDRPQGGRRDDPLAQRSAMDDGDEIPFMMEWR